jgi:hypothetical protein
MPDWTADVLDGTGHATLAGVGRRNPVRTPVLGSPLRASAQQQRMPSTPTWSKAGVRRRPGPRLLLPAHFNNPPEGVIMTTASSSTTATGPPPSAKWR